MSSQSASVRVIASADLRKYFHDSIGDVLSKQGIDATVETVFYIVNLLTVFQRADRLYDFNGDRMEIRPLAMFYADALDGRSTEERNRIIQRMGDIALFISGLFAESLTRKLVDVDYYIAMGSNAYGLLSESLRGSSRGDAFCDIFEELSQNFTRFVDVLAEVNEGAAVGDDAEILRQYEIWLQTGSRRARNRLRRLGIEPGAGLSGEPVRNDH